MIKMKRRLAFCLVMILLIGGLIGFVNLSTDAEAGNGDAEIRSASQSKSGLTVHAPIYINGNAHFASQAENEGWAGDGTEANPYIIENYTIRASTANGIEIRNTNVYFIIRNCVIYDGYDGVYPNYYGIYFYNVQNGKIDNVTSYNNFYGIYLQHSSNNNTIANCAVYNNSYGGIRLWESSNNNQITNCAVYNNTDGIRLESSSNNNQITNCAVYNNTDGIRLGSSSNNNSITNCAVYNNSYGIWLYSSSNNNITDNIFTNNGIGFCGDLEDCIQTIENNTVNGKPLYYFLNENGITIDNEDVGQLILVNCTDFTIKNLDISYTAVAVHFLYSSNNTITNCTVYNNSRGIWLCYSSNNNQITNCYVYNNDWYGIYLCYSSNNNQITNCYVYNNYWRGIYLYSSSNNNQITNCTVYNNSDGIYLCYSSNNEIHYCNIYDNTNYGVYNHNSEIEYQTNAIYCWWGSASGAGQDGANPVSLNILYDPWLMRSAPVYFPIAIIFANPVVVEIGQPITFDASASYDLDGNVTQYYFDFGDGSNTGWINENSKSHLYTTSGVYTVTLKVKDDAGVIGTTSVTVTVCQPVQTITPSGGAVVYINVVIMVPEGAVTQNVTFIVTKISTPNPSGYIIIGDVCRIETDVTSFVQPMTLILSYNESNLPAGVGEDDLAIYKKVGDSWVKLDSTVDKTNNTVSTVVTGFSDYAILYKKPSAGSETYEIPWLYIVILVSIIIALIGAGFGIKKKTAGKVKKSTIKISCPSCKTMFEVEEQERPFKVKCPKCGEEGTIK